jgi:DNA polymerase III alpha subunit
VHGRHHGSDGCGGNRIWPAEAGGGIVSSVKQLMSKSGQPWVVLTLDDPTGTAEVMVFNVTYTVARELCVADRILVIKGKVDHKQQGETKLIAQELIGFEGVAERRDVTFRLDAREAPAGVIRELARLVKEYPGESPVYLSLETSLGTGTSHSLVLKPTSVNVGGILASLPSHVKRPLLASWKQKMAEPQDLLLERMIDCLADEEVCPVEDDTKQALANCVRKHYLAHPEAIDMQASGNTVPPTVNNHLKTKN